MKTIEIKNLKKRSAKQLKQLVNREGYDSSTIENALNILTERLSKKEKVVTVYESNETFSLIPQNDIITAGNINEESFVVISAKVFEGLKPATAAPKKKAKSEQPKPKTDKYEMHGKRELETTTNGHTFQPGDEIWYVTGSKKKGFTAHCAEYRHRNIDKYHGPRGYVVIKDGKKIVERSLKSVWASEKEAQAAIEKRLS